MFDQLSGDHAANAGGHRNPLFISLTSLGFAALLLVSSQAALAQTAPPLGSTSTYGIVASTYTNTAGGTTINGDVCYTTGPAVLPTINGTNSCVAALGGDQGTALASLDSQLSTCLTLGAAVDLSLITVGANPPGTFPPGCYSSTGAMNIGTTIRLNGSGVYIFRPGAGVSAAALNSAANSSVLLQNGAEACNVFWAPVSATTLGANSTFIGTVIDAAGITVGDTVTWTGRALAFGGTVSTAGDTISVPAPCASVPPGPVPVPTLPEWAMIMLVALLALAGYAAMRRRVR